MSEGLNNLGRHIATFVRLHPPLLGVVAAAVVLRILVEIAYWPALFYSDSWEYIQLAYSKSIVAFSGSRPSGYPLLIHLLSLPGRNLATITIVQHLAGLATGVIAYALLRRLGIRTWLAVVVAAVILLDSYAIALEQHIMAETFVALALLLSAAIAAFYNRRPLPMAAGGVLLAGAVSMRVAALFAVPAFVLFVIVRAQPKGARGDPCRPRVTASRIRVGARCRWPGLRLHREHRRLGSPAGVASIADCRGADIPAETAALPDGR